MKISAYNAATEDSFTGVLSVVDMAMKSFADGPDRRCTDLFKDYERSQVFCYNRTADSIGSFVKTTDNRRIQSWETN